jgi:hypothetical protein
MANNLDANRPYRLWHAMNEEMTDGEEVGTLTGASPVVDSYSRGDRLLVNVDPTSPAGAWFSAWASQVKPNPRTLILRDTGQGWVRLDRATVRRAVRGPDSIRAVTDHAYYLDVEGGHRLREGHEEVPPFMTLLARISDRAAVAVR